MARRRLERCDQHVVSNLGYMAWHEDAEIRMARGERQYKCGECGLYQWPSQADRTARVDRETQQ